MKSLIESIIGRKNSNPNSHIKQSLQNGDVLETRSGIDIICLLKYTNDKKPKDVFLAVTDQTNGVNYAEDWNDDLKTTDGDDMWDIIKVYRRPDNISFDYDDIDLSYIKKIKRKVNPININQ